MKYIEELLSAMSEFWTELFWDFRGSLIPYKTYKIWQNEEDYKKYIKAVENLHNGSKSETFTLHTGEVMTIY